jgi:NADH-quinone oxidoreductase subunit A
MPARDNRSPVRKPARDTSVGNHRSRNQPLVPRGDIPGFLTIRIPDELAKVKMLENYLPILIFLIIGLIMGVALFAVGYVMGPHHPDSEKSSPYECGFEAFEDARMKFDVRYYLVAILFIIFDLEIAFFFPWAVALREIGMGDDGVSGRAARWFHL